MAKALAIMLVLAAAGSAAAARYQLKPSATSAWGVTLDTNLLKAMHSPFASSVLKAGGIDTVATASAGYEEPELYPKPDDEYKKKEDEEYPRPKDGYKPPSDEYKPPSDGYKPPHDAYKPPSDEYKPPHDGYKPPHDEYKPPHDEYKPPHDGYKPPSDEYKPPHDGYKGDHHEEEEPKYGEGKYGEGKHGKDYHEEEPKYGEGKHGKDYHEEEPKYGEGKYGEDKHGKDYHEEEPKYGEGKYGEGKYGKDYHEEDQYGGGGKKHGKGGKALVKFEATNIKVNGVAPAVFSTNPASKYLVHMDLKCPPPPPKQADEADEADEWLIMQPAEPVLLSAPTVAHCFWSIENQPSAVITKDAATSSDVLKLVAKGDLSCKFNEHAKRCAPFLDKDLMVAAQSLSYLQTPKAPKGKLPFPQFKEATEATIVMGQLTGITKPSSAVPFKGGLVQWVQTFNAAPAPLFAPEGDDEPKPSPLNSVAFVFTY